MVSHLCASLGAGASAKYPTSILHLSLPAVFMQDADGYLLASPSHKLTGVVNAATGDDARPTSLNRPNGLAET